MVHPEANIFRSNISLKATEFKSKLKYDEIIFCFESLQVNRRQLKYFQSFNRTESKRRKQTEERDKDSEGEK